MTLGDRLRAAWSSLTSGPQSPEQPRREKGITSRDFYGPDGGGGSGFGPSFFGGAKSPGGLGYPYSTIIGLDYQALRNRSRTAKWESTEAEGIIGRLVDNIIGTGLSIQSAPIWELIEPKADAEDEATTERRHKIKRDIEVRHNLYLNSTEPDATGTRSGYNLQAFEAESLFWDGEVFKVFRYSDDPNRMSPLYFQFYLADQICQPGNAELTAAKARGNCVSQGIELTTDGREVAIFVAEDPFRPTVTVRIPFWSDDGKRRFVAHPKITDKPGQVRGVPLLANVLHELTKITDGKIAELEALVLNALFAVWKRPSDKAPTGAAPGGIGKPTSTTPQPNAPMRVDQSGNTQFLRPGIMFPALKAGEALESFDTKRPNLNVTAFIDQIMTGVASAKGLSVEMLQLKFNTAYTAARAAMLQTWVKIEMWRETIDTQSIGPEFTQWLTEEVTARRIKAPGFGKSPLLTQAWLNHSLLGSSMPSIDPMKEASAVQLRLEMGHTTGEREAMRYNGSDFTENTGRQKVENEDLAEARAPLLVTPGGTNAAPGTPTQGELPFGGPEKPSNSLPLNPKNDPKSPEYDPNFDDSNDAGAAG